MGTSPTVTATFSAEILRRDTSAARWLDGLPGLWRSLSTEWGVEIDGPTRNGATSLVVPVVTRSGVRAAVKLASPVVRIDPEVAALSAFAGRGAVRLLDADTTRQAMLLEWIDGTALSELHDTVAAMAIAGRLSRELAGATPPPDAPSLAGQANGWSAQLREQHLVAQRSGAALSNEHLQVALEAIDRLASDGTSTLTHGDLSLANILQADGDRWVAIDPLLLVGTPANEAHTVTRSHLATAIGSDDPSALLVNWTRRFTEAAEVDFSTAHALSFARYIASYYWESQNDGEPVNVARLRQAALLLAPLA
ncbi:aminoglycoside phosphotransferase family protein [Marisediminicola senii]|uniref:aminoglycoside phosphotransferase family protein n=1 Tax=Marisediminicola senii TaxID=2711233 RepID=UPI0013ED5F99|nr:aminoglycoside phosphotransferase family protein [Marisediminicola senii]